MSFLNQNANLDEPKNKTEGFLGCKCAQKCAQKCDENVAKMQMKICTKM